MPSSEVMGKFKRGALHSGSKHGKKVTSRKQAIAIMLSEQRAEQAHGGRYPEKKRRSTKKRTRRGSPIIRQAMGVHDEDA